MLLDFNRLRYAGFSGAPIIMSQTGGDVANPRRDDFFHAAGANELIELHVGDRTDQRQSLSLLPNDLVTRRERNQRFETAAHRDRHAVFDIASDGVMKRANLVHT